MLRPLSQEDSTSERLGHSLAEYLKGRYLQRKGRSGRNRQCSISGRSSPDFGKIKILSKHLLPQGEGVLARASLLAVWVQCRPDFPLEHLSMDIGPAHQPCSPLAFPSGAEPHSFPTLGTVPHNFPCVGFLYVVAFMSYLSDFVSFGVALNSRSLLRKFACLEVSLFLPDT